ncbi:MAG: spermidine synthase [Acidimicrobiia bacterium]
MLMFGGAGFLGAMLLFTIQPMAAKALLPVLGGSAAVWNTAMAFFQLALLAGYLAAHLTGTLVPPRWRMAVQLLLLTLPLLMLPFGFAERPRAVQSPVWWELGALTMMVGAPFFALSTLSPTIQGWFARTDHPRARDPFFLYAASNIGSFLGLLAYPLVIEPHLDLIDQARWFRWGYSALLVTVAVAALKTRQRTTLEVQVSNHPAVRWQRRAFWVSAAAVPSLMLLAVSRHIATDVASFPLLWVVPLAMYLGTFIVAFSGYSQGVTGLAGLVYPLLAVAAAAATAGTLVNIWLGVGLPLGLLAASGLLVHGRLYASRPGPGGLTEFYLWVSVGGAIGGLFGAFVAPVVFDWIAEYPIAIAATAAFLVGHRSRPRPFMPRPFLIAMAVIYVAGLLLAATSPATTTTALLLGVAGVGAYGLASRSPWLALLLAGILGLGGLHTEGDLLAQERTFFGVTRVIADTNGRHVMVSGTTVHGAQDFKPVPQLLPLTYYTAAGPIGQVMTDVGSKTDNIGIIGLGTGALASYLHPDQNLVFYEIDAAVVDIAENRSLFTFTSEALGRIEFVVGDGRLALDQSHEPFGVLIIDAFSSDAIPTHLLTVEALQKYLEAITDDGVVGFHISNRHLDLEPVVGRLAAEMGLTALVKHSQPISPDGSPVSFLVMARRPADLGPIVADRSWAPPRVGPDLWTDNFSDLLSVIRWG